MNNWIKASEVRVVDDAGEQLGVMPLAKALQMAGERDLDLIQVTKKVDPPVCKIMNHGKYLYSLQKKEKKEKTKRVGEMKGIRLKFNISDHDLETRANQADKFLKKGNKLKIEMKLWGRQKALGNFAKEKMNKFLEFLKKKTPINIERELKKEPRGLTMIISRDTKQE